ncbi:DUF4376 domain-containing protein [Comamonas odontotermitis]|uniref:DUF4376 domain-containing protein n=1 Tax=Comamonas odontotermitis TaxID=379895 RepID=UPI001CC7B5E7|nr:DUF4376 domain-containing protein [Comamonas odontotermitis]UBB16129.1 DUF4376 domain-containing protein [Comamonas odontotermitis]
MSTYQFNRDYLSVTRLADGKVIRFDDQDPNYPEFKAWAETNLPLLPELTLEELQEQNANAPIQPLDRALEWFEDARVGLPQLVGGEWVRPVEAVDLRADANLPVLKERLLLRLADVRYQHETGGILINGSQVKTDRESQATITGAYTRAIDDPATTVRWKADNHFVTLDAEAIKMFGGAVFAHVQGCFAHEADFAEQIELCKKVDALLVLAVMINEGWGA